ncbi:hypothetical protein C3747_13g2179c [Trypanosoma cruzi]|uniref:Uncharacterized protein n=2 Tax=Trypanosoma cruzi TaxID=5693 RepID=Q4CXD4_TRYCC|nr:hypothetical protein, conserved [Trypanosoma cruzi]EAN84937.1 hypothetical protein, conserved [Trypanosoma cruzi]KAF8293524.1 hypothetical protein TcYC6_0111190 [Trypanosoma cruzi]PWV18434.1 hypothetical protein C3747_13g2179c [Trypanosoma cruzi]|eukprot:XP_806788.1 hypothetical protein [Trypanosoma cruzi strain CL Brener]
MGLFRALKFRLIARYELMRARMAMRGVADHELIGRYCGLALIPFTVYICAGTMQGYAKDRVKDSLSKRGK